MVGVTVARDLAVCLLTLVDSGIPPGATFDYEVPINSSGQWGTYWVHAHASVRLPPPAPRLRIL